MGSDDLLAIREDLNSRSGDIVEKWYNGAFKDQEQWQGTPTELKGILKNVVEESIGVITSRSFGPSKARGLGRDLSELRLGGKDFLGRTHEILIFEITKDLTIDQLPLIYHDLTSFIANFTSGYFEGSLKEIEIEQERVHEKLMYDLLQVDERLKKTNEELEAKVEERTAELKRLNDELKNEADIRKKAENILKQREHLLSVIFDTSFLWTGLLDPDGRMILPNKPSLDFMGLKKEDVIGKYCWETPWWIHSNELQMKVKNAIGEARRGTPSRFDVFHIDPKGNRQDVQFSIRPVKNNLGEVIYLIPEGVNITHRKEVERELTNLNEVLSLINKIMRHDIQNRLSVAYGNLGLMMERGSYDPDLLKVINTAMKSAIDLTKRMADLENLVHGREGSREFDLEEVISRVVENYPLKHKIKGNSRVLADEAIGSIFENLISNAIVHGEATRIDFEISDDGVICIIRISNDGEAIPETIRERVFEESFSWGDEKGSGLGLYITRMIVERYQGTIDLVNDTDGMTLFEIRMPVVRS